MDRAGNRSFQYEKIQKKFEKYLANWKTSGNFTTLILFYYDIKI